MYFILLLNKYLFCFYSVRSSLSKVPLSIPCTHVQTHCSSLYSWGAMVSVFYSFLTRLVWLKQDLTGNSGGNGVLLVEEICSSVESKGTHRLVNESWVEHVIHQEMVFDT